MWIIFIGNCVEGLKCMIEEQFYVRAHCTHICLKRLCGMWKWKDAEFFAKGSVWGFRPPGKPQPGVRTGVKGEGSVFMSSEEDEKQGPRDQGELLRCQNMGWMSREGYAIGVSKTKRSKSSLMDQQKAQLDIWYACGFIRGGGGCKMEY